MHPAALIWATVLAADGGAASDPSVTSSSTLPVAIVGALSLVVVALIPELFRWLRRNQVAPTPSAVITPAALDAAEARITAALEVKMATVTERANSARAEVRALRRALEARDDQFREALQQIRDELNRHVWANGDDVPTPREPTG